MEGGLTRGACPEFFRRTQTKPTRDESVRHKGQSAGVSEIEVERQLRHPIPGLLDRTLLDVAASFGWDSVLVVRSLRISLNDSRPLYLQCMSQKSSQTYFLSLRSFFSECDTTSSVFISLGMNAVRKPTPFYIVLEDARESGILFKEPLQTQYLGC